MHLGLQSVDIDPESQVGRTKKLCKTLLRPLLTLLKGQECKKRLASSTETKREDLLRLRQEKLRETLEKTFLSLGKALAQACQGKARALARVGKVLA